MLDISPRLPNACAEGERGAWAAALAADLKLLVDGDCRIPCWEGGILEPCWRVANMPRLPDAFSIEPKVGVVARWINSGGGGDNGRGGGISCDDLLSGIKEGGSMLPPGGGGALGGGGSDIIGGLVLSTGAGVVDVVRERGKSSRYAEDSADSMDCLRSFRRSDWDVRGRIIVDDSREWGGESGAIGTKGVVGLPEAGDDTNWNCWLFRPGRYNPKPGLGEAGMTVGVEVRAGVGAETGSAIGTGAMTGGAGGGCHSSV